MHIFKLTKNFEFDILTRSLIIQVSVTRRLEILVSVDFLITNPAPAG